MMHGFGLPTRAPVASSARAGVTWTRCPAGRAGSPPVRIVPTGSSESCTGPGNTARTRRPPTPVGHRPRRRPGPPGTFPNPAPAPRSFAANRPAGARIRETVGVSALSDAIYWATTVSAQAVSAPQPAGMRPPGLCVAESAAPPVRAHTGHVPSVLHPARGAPLTSPHRQPRRGVGSSGTRAITIDRCPQGAATPRSCAMCPIG